MNLSFPSDHSIAFTSLTMTPLVYLNRLLTRIHSLGGHIHRAHLSSISNLSHPSTLALIGEKPQAVVVCTGLGSLTLGEVEDTTVYPTRGQIIKVNAPWIRSGYTRQVGTLDGGEGGERTYIIPRADGEVILGGTREEGDWDPHPREETSRDIIRRAVEICPDLVPHHRRGEADHGVEGLVLEHLVGFRPSRRDGVRLERGPDLSLGDGEVKVVYNYGHGGAGWQSCWGYAEDARDLLTSSLHLQRSSL
jgi:D-amino-acid oxidase